MKKSWASLEKEKKKKNVEKHQQDPAEYFLTEVHSFGWWGFWVLYFMTSGRIYHLLGVFDIFILF